jgi:hypothetical protein
MTGQRSAACQASVRLEQPHRQQRPRRDGEREPHREQPGVQPKVAAELPQSHPGGVREQNPHQGHLGEQLDKLLRHVELDDVQPLGEQQSNGDEHDGRAQVRATEPSREQTPGEDDQRDQRHGCRIHARLPVRA